MYATLPPFDPPTMLRSGAVGLIIGHQNSGKTTLMCDLFKGRDLHGGLIVEHTLNSRQYGDLADQADLFLEEFRESAATELISRQRRAGADASDSFVILDDCIYHISLYLSRPIRTLFEHGRSLRTTTLIAQTYAMGLPPTVRTRIDWVFVFRESIRPNVRRIHEQYIRCGLSLSAFEALLRLPREDYDCLAIDYGNTGQIYRYHANRNRVPRPSSLLKAEEFDPPMAIRPGDRCAFTGTGRKTPILCDLLSRLPDLSAGYLLMHEDAAPPFQDYAPLRDRVRTAARSMRYGHSLAQHLLDLSENSFVVLEDNCTHFGNIALNYLEAHRRELGITVFSSEPYMPADRPDFLFVTYPRENRDHALRSVHETMGIADRIPFHEFRDLVHSLDYLRFECVVIERRTGRLWLYHPHETWG
jgi:hypothetical protein